MRYAPCMLLLALATAGLAGEPRVPPQLPLSGQDAFCDTLRERLATIQLCGPHGVRKIDGVTHVYSLPPACLATMEAAMRAIDPWVPERVGEGVSGAMIYRAQKAMPLEIGKQWAEAKRCWRTP